MLWHTQILKLLTLYLDIKFSRCFWPTCMHECTFVACCYAKSLKKQKNWYKYNKAPVFLFSVSGILFLLWPGKNLANVYGVVLKTGLLATKVQSINCMKENKEQMQI